MLLHSQSLTDMLDTVMMNYRGIIPVRLHTSYDKSTGCEINDTRRDAEKEKHRREQRANTTELFSS